MKVGAASIGYTSGALYKRNKSIGYTPGAHYQRFGKLGLHQPRNMSSMNRQAAESASYAFQNAGPQMFDAKAAQSQGLSELAAQQVMKRVKEMANAVAERGESLSLANSLKDSDGDGSDDTTGSVVDKTA